MKENPKKVEKDEEKLFPGFIPPVDDYFRMPNGWINICAQMDSLAELKVVQYVLRHTWGYQDYDGLKKITLDEFMNGRKRKDGTRIDNGTGLSDRGVKNGIGLATEHGYLEYEIDDHDKARIKKYYGLKMLSHQKEQNSGGKNVPPGIPDRKNVPISDGKNVPPDGKNIPISQEHSSHRSEKNTLVRHLKKDIEKDTSSSYTPTSEQSKQPSSSLTTAAAALSLTQLKNLSAEDLSLLKAEIDTLLIIQPGNNQASQPFKEMSAAPDGQNSQEKQNIIKDVEVLEAELMLERPGADAPRTAETVVQLIEYLRSAQYPPKERTLELRKAAMLLNLQEVPGISIAEIEEAWQHGSDT